jgi:DNA-directed RNA polymerase subunit F
MKITVQELKALIKEAVAEKMVCESPEENLKFLNMSESERKEAAKKLSDSLAAATQGYKKIANTLTTKDIDDVSDKKIDEFLRNLATMENAIDDIRLLARKLVARL